MRAHYLLRFDDICATMNWSVWRRVEEALLHAGVRPILAVVPDNQDEALRVSTPNSHFWDEVRVWQARGWTIGLHGYQHKYVSRDAGLLGIKEASEFSGLGYDQQVCKLRAALNIFARERVIPEIWVAPAHSFDQQTLNGLSELDLRCLSDGFAMHPYRDSRGMLWVPQQLWRFRQMPLGLWTICFHLNRWSEADVERFKSDLGRYAKFITDLPSIVTAYQNRKRTLLDISFSGTYTLLRRGKHWVRGKIFKDILNVHRTFDH